MKKEKIWFATFLVCIQKVGKKYTVKYVKRKGKK